MNQLYYGDNLAVLRDHLKDESVDLIYLDPPFNSKRDYNLLFKSPKGQKSEAQIEAFKDSWSWGDQAERELHEILKQKNTDVSQMMNALLGFLGRNDMTAYLVMMANRLLELHRALKPTGSLYLHCDPTASHYLKIVLDAVFGKENFQNEIVWKRTTTKNDYTQGAVNWARIHDVILYLTKDRTKCPPFTQPFEEYSDEYVASKYPHTDKDGRRYGLWDLTAPGSGSRGHPQYELMGVTRYWRYNKEKMLELAAEGRVIQPSEGAVPRYKRFLDEMQGIAIGDVWNDIPPINSQAQERLGYPTQKPLALLERIIAASSNEGDVVLDPFCGCGTAVHAAQKLGRKWIGIDITCLAIRLVEGRLKKAFPEAFGEEGKRLQFEVIGLPKDLESARDLARRDKYQFQWWAVGIIDEAQPWQGKKKGADTGIDGIRYFRDLDRKEFHTILISVKGGENVGSAMVKDLIATLARDKADIGLFITLAAPTKAMLTEAAAAGFYESPTGKKYARLQLLTIEGLLNKTQRAEYPDYEPDTGYKKAKAEAHGDQRVFEMPG
jgi:DNA modification methylase